MSKTLATLACQMRWHLESSGSPLRESAQLHLGPRPCYCTEPSASPARPGTHLSARTFAPLGGHFWATHTGTGSAARTRGSWDSAALT